MFLIDSHCHLNRLNYQFIHKNLDEVLAKAAHKNVKFCLSVATTLTDYRDMRKLIGRRHDVAFSCGVHPLNQETYNIEELRSLAAEDCVVAIGETGLDYHSTLETKVLQQKSFIKHIHIGRELNKPVIIHTRDASIDTITILKKENIIECGGVIHCFSGNIEMAAKFLDLGLYLSFSGIVTFSNTEQLRDVVRYTPLDRLLLETDSPYLTPVPYRGKENQPAMTYYIAKHLALLKDIELVELACITTENFAKLFKIDPIYLRPI